MRFQTRHQIVKNLVDPAPLVDVVFLLLLFFILSSPFVMQSGFGVYLPTTDTPTASSFQELVVTVTRQDLIFFNNQPVTPTSLQRLLEEIVKGGRQKELIIKADQQVPHGTVVKVMSIALKAGISVVNIAARVDISAVTNEE